MCWSEIVDDKSIYSKFFHHCLNGYKKIKAYENLKQETASCKPGLTVEMGKIKVSWTSLPVAFTHSKYFIIRTNFPLFNFLFGIGFSVIHHSLSLLVHGAVRWQARPGIISTSLVVKTEIDLNLQTEIFMFARKQLRTKAFSSLVSCSVHFIYIYNLENKHLITGYTS